MPRLPNEVSDGAAKADAANEYTPRGEGRRGDWIRVGRYDGCRRRALWVRFIGLDDTGMTTKCKAIEMCAGREGDDAFVKVVKRGNPLFADLLDVMLRASDHIPGRYPDEPSP